MDNNVIIVESRKINDYVYHVDLKGYGKPKILSGYVCEFDEGFVILDCGSSQVVKHIPQFFKRNNLDLSRVVYLVPSHHHFDHAGGMWKLYDQIKELNPQVKIVINLQTMGLLNDYKVHLSRAKRTYGDFIGEMQAIPEDAFHTIEPLSDFSVENIADNPIRKFHVNGEEVVFSILHTPGHTSDHQSPVFLKADVLDFIFLGEAIGTMHHSTKLLTMPTSMPVYFNFEEYTTTITKLKQIWPIMAGIGHFGVINGKENVRAVILENESYTGEFRAKIQKYYKEKPETRYIVDKIVPDFAKRTDLVGDNLPFLKNIVLGVVYGMMMDLGYRKD